jgi:dienelactone hydrolase
MERIGQRDDVKPILLALLPAIALAEPALRQGRFHTPEQAKAEMDARWQDYGTREGWEKRAAAIRQGILESAGLWPLPERKPPVVIRRPEKKQAGYTVENVALETAPGFFLCGNLYLPEVREKMPVVLSSHGHGPMTAPLAHGRFHEVMQKRCGALARMGCAVFAYEMVGYGESALAGWKHGVTGRELRMQLWNSIRVLDFMLTLPGADATRVAVTGESGGATQAFLLAAVDGRVTASIPCVQVSSWFYGGCACESGLPIHVRPGHVANNAEIAAVIAPKPLLVISDGKDWTQNVPELELPRLKRIYGLFGKEDAVENAHFTDEGHDYGPSKRAALYRFLGTTFGLDEKKADEASVPVLPGESLRAFDGKDPRPEKEVPANSEVRLY